jgi:hypothetical protein
MMGHLKIPPPPPPPPVRDRARTETDSLRPECGDPQFAASELRCVIDAHGVVALAPLPTSRLKLHVSMSGSSAETTVPASREDTHVVVRLKAN